MVVFQTWLQSAYSNWEWPCKNFLEVSKIDNLFYNLLGLIIL